MTDELDAKLNDAVKPIRDKGGDHHGLADAIVAAVKSAVEHLRAELAPKPGTVAAVTTKADIMLANAGYVVVDPAKPADAS